MKKKLAGMMFKQIIDAYPDKFKTVFRKASMNKEILLQLASKANSQYTTDTTDNLNLEIKSQFGEFVVKKFKQYARKDEINEEELIRNIKMMLKYGKGVIEQQIQQILNILINNIYARAKQVACEELKYYIFLMVQTFDYDRAVSLRELNKQVSQIYHSKCMKSPNQQNLTKMINIEYQLCRKYSHPSLRTNIFQYNYQNIQLAPTVYSYLFYLMKKNKGTGTNQEKSSVINQLKQDIYRLFAQQKLYIRVIFTLIDVLDEINFTDKFIYTDIERALGKHLQKILSSSNKKENLRQIFLPKDITFLKSKLAKNDKCSKKFISFLVQSQKNYNLINDYAKEYLENSKNWENMRANYKRNKQEKKSQIRTPVKLKKSQQNLLKMNERLNDFKFM